MKTNKNKFKFDEEIIFTIDVEGFDAEPAEVEFDLYYNKKKVFCSEMEECCFKLDVTDYEPLDGSFDFTSNIEKGWGKGLRYLLQNEGIDKLNSRKFIIKPRAIISEDFSFANKKKEVPMKNIKIKIQFSKE